MTLTSIDINRPQPFNPHVDPSSLGQRWSRWLRNFERFVTASDVTNDLRKKALLLNLAGDDVCEIFDNLPESGTSYAEAIACLNQHFKPKNNIYYEAFIFRKATQLADESISEFYTRLRSLAATCEFNDRLDFELIMQILVGTRLEPLQKKILSKPDLTLKDVLEYERTEEMVITQRHAISNEANDHTVNKIRVK